MSKCNFLFYKTKHFRLRWLDAVKTALCRMLIYQQQKRILCILSGEGQICFVRNSSAWRLLGVGLKTSGDMISTARKSNILSSYRRHKCQLYNVHGWFISFGIHTNWYWSNSLLLMTIKLSTYLGWLSRTRNDNVWLDYPAQDNWWHISVSPTLSAHQISVMICHWPLHIIQSQATQCPQ